MIDGMMLIAVVLAFAISLSSCEKEEMVCLDRNGVNIVECNE